MFVCVEVLRPSQPNGVMLSVVSLPNHTFTGQAYFYVNSEDPYKTAGMCRLISELLEYVLIPFSAT